MSNRSVEEEPGEDAFTNHYFHCDVQWDDTWSCQCDDRCPVCNAEIEPYASTDNATGELDVHAPDVAKLADVV